MSYPLPLTAEGDTLGLWKLQDTGSTAEEEVNNYDLTYYNYYSDPYQGRETPWGTFRVFPTHGAPLWLGLYAAADHAHGTPIDTAIVAASNCMTVEALVYTDLTHSLVGTLVELGRNSLGAGYRFQAGLWSSTFLRFMHHDASSIERTFTLELPVSYTGRWLYVAWARSVDGSDVSMLSACGYLDGSGIPQFISGVGTDSHGVIGSISTKMVTVGRTGDIYNQSDGSWNDTYYFYGVIAGVRLTPRAKTLGEIQSLWTGTIGPQLAPVPATPGPQPVLVVGT